MQELHHRRDYTCTLSLAGFQAEFGGDGGAKSAPTATETSKPSMASMTTTTAATTAATAAPTLRPCYPRPALCEI